jgi:hypothetical protein
MTELWERKKQIPCGNGNKKSNNNGKSSNNGNYNGASSILL